MGLQTTTTNNPNQKSETAQSSSNGVCGNRIRKQAEKFQLDLVRQFGDPSKLHHLRSTTSTVRLHRDVLAELTILERSDGYTSHSESVRGLLRGARKNLPLPGTAKSVYYGDALANVFGPSGIGKTTFIKK